MRIIEIRDYKRLEEISNVEKGTMGSYTYVDDAWNYYWNTEGSFLAAEKDGKIVGIAHLAVLPDKAGWFEALRVLPEYQNQGVGKALYEKAIELCKERYHCVSLSMYTGRKNVRSVALAQKFGLVNEYEHLEYNYEVNCPATRGTFRNINWLRAQETALPLSGEYGGFVSVNRTWYRINEPNIRMMADKGYFYEDEEGNMVCLGTRFQHDKKLFVLMLKGDYRKGMDFAVNLAYARNISTLTCTFVSSNRKLEQALKDYGFTPVGEMITRERIFG